MNSKKNNWSLDGIEFKPEHSKFDVVRDGKKEATVFCQLFGEYNLLNALAVYAMGRQLGIEKEKLVKGFESFKGVKRRQEIIGKPGGITVIDDFAHHPTAVAVTIDGVKKRFPYSNVFAVFEPRSATARRKVFQTAFAEALVHADTVVLSVPYDQSKISEDERFDADAVIKYCQQMQSKQVMQNNQIVQNNHAKQSSKTAPKKEALLGHSPDEIIQILKSRAKSGDVILFMSNGGFGGIYEKILKVL